MDWWVWLIIALVVVALLGLVAFAWQAMQRQRTERLRGRFGSEYDRTMERTGDRKEAESELEGRRKRVERLKLHDIAPQERQRLQNEWEHAQSRFVDEPREAIDDAERLVEQAMSARGYPVGDDFDRRYEDLSVEYASVLDNYRHARDISYRRHDGGKTTTEDLRDAMVCYRDLFRELVNSAGPPSMQGRRSA